MNAKVIGRGGRRSGEERLYKRRGGEGRRREWVERFERVAKERRYKAGAHDGDLAPIGSCKYVNFAVYVRRTRNTEDSE